MTRERVILIAQVLAVAGVIYVASAVALMAVQGWSLAEALVPNEATVVYSLLGGLAGVMLWRNR